MERLLEGVRVSLSVCVVLRKHEREFPLRCLANQRRAGVTGQTTGGEWDTFSPYERRSSVKVRRSEVTDNDASHSVPR